MIKANDAMATLLDALESFGELAGAGCRWKVCSGNAVLPEPELPLNRTRHDDPFCLAVKQLDCGQERCIYNDGCLLFQRIRAAEHGFVHRCHAGAVEVVVPIRIASGECVGVVMTGPYRLPESEIFAPCADAFATLPVLKPAAATAIMKFAPGIFGEIVRRIYVEFADVLTAPPEDERIVRVLEYLRKNLPKAPTVADVAADVFMSPSRLLHLFKAECGLGLGEYILKLRLREARRYLMTDELPISQVAATTGFADQSHFTALFRREFGLPPLQYRKRHGRRR